MRAAYRYIVGLLILTAAWGIIVVAGAEEAIGSELEREWTEDYNWTLPEWGREYVIPLRCDEVALDYEANGTIELYSGDHLMWRGMSGQSWLWHHEGTALYFIPVDENVTISVHFEFEEWSEYRYIEWHPGLAFGLFVLVWLPFNLGFVVGAREVLER